MLLETQLSAFIAKAQPHELKEGHCVFLLQFVYLLKNDCLFKRSAHLFYILTLYKKEKMLVKRLFKTLYINLSIDLYVLLSL